MLANTERPHVSKRSTFRRALNELALLDKERRHAAHVRAGKASAAGSRTRGEARKAAQAEIDAYLARVPDPI